MFGPETAQRPAQAVLFAETAAPIGRLILARIAPDGGATRSEIAADLAGFFAHKLSPGDWRATVDREIELLVQSCLATETRNRLKTSGAGSRIAAAFCGLPTNEIPEWPVIRDRHLVALSLGLQREPVARLNMTGDPDGLRALILQSAFDLPASKAPPVGKLRVQLSHVALERAFGNTMKAEDESESEPTFTPKAGRALAGQLCVPRRDFGTDQQLVAALAAEQAGAMQTNFEELQAALWRRIGTSLLSAQANSNSAPERTGSTGDPKPISSPQQREEKAPAHGEKTLKNRPDPGTFATAVKLASAGHAEGWPGNRKAFISQVWQAIRTAHPAWDLSEIEFKCMLAEAHRLGHIVLATADLKDKNSLAALESSAIAYKNTVWHFVRVEED